MLQYWYPNMEENWNLSHKKKQYRDSIRLNLIIKYKYTTCNF